MSDTVGKEITKEQIELKVKKFIIDNFMFGNESEQINSDASFMETGIIDSTGILELIEFVEDEYDINIDDTELIPENLDSLENITTFILSKK